MKRWQRLLRQACLGLLAPFILLLSACNSGATTASGTPTPAPLPIGAAGEILVQLFPDFAFIAPQFNAVPGWTLYADGTLIFKSGDAFSSSTALLQAQLSSAEVQHILDVVINQHHFFASTQPTYGLFYPDAGFTLLTVNTNEQQKTVSVGNSQGRQPDEETANIFAIQDFLLQQKPASAVPYDAPGIALLVYPINSPGDAAWPFDDLSLAQIAEQECQLLRPGEACNATANQQPAIKMLTGPRARTILAGFNSASTVTQNGNSYLITPWPLLPDALHPASGSAASVRVTRAGPVMEWPLSA
jgi:hypothetical protein